MRVLFVSCDPLDGAVTRYRCVTLAEALRTAGHAAEVAWIGQPTLRLDHDAVVLHRICANREGAALARAVRRSGAALIYGADDDVFTDDCPGRALALDAFAPLHRAMLVPADSVLVSTEPLAQRARALHPSVCVLPNVPGADLIQRSEAARATRSSSTVPLAAYLSGTPTHDADLAELAAPLAIFRRAGGQLLLVGPVAAPVGIVADFREPIQPWTILPSVLVRADINLAPLTPTPFTQGKSALKWQEAALVGVPTVASAHGPFLDSIEHGVDGLLADSEAAWDASLDRLRTDSAFGRSLADAARRRVIDAAEALPEQAASVFSHWVGGSRRITPTAVLNPLGFAKASAKRLLAR
jgi:hypothetical protein